MQEAFSKNFDFSGNLKKIDFLIKVLKNLDFFQAISQQILIFYAEIVHLQLLLGKLFFSLQKSPLKRTYFLYMIGYNNISRPFHDPPDPTATPWTPLPNIWGVATHNLPGLTPLTGAD